MRKGGFHWTRWPSVSYYRGGVLNQALKAGPGPGQGGRHTPLVGGAPGKEAPAGGGAAAGGWSNLLDANRAGAAMDAESFTQVNK